MKRGRSQRSFSFLFSRTFSLRLCSLPNSLSTCMRVCVRGSGHVTFGILVHTTQGRTWKWSWSDLRLVFSQRFNRMYWQLLLNESVRKLWSSSAATAVDAIYAAGNLENGEGCKSISVVRMRQSMTSLLQGELCECIEAWWSWEVAEGIATVAPWIFFLRSAQHDWKMTCWSHFLNQLNSWTPAVAATGVPSQNLQLRVGKNNCKLFLIIIFVMSDTLFFVGCN